MTAELLKDRTVLSYLLVVMPKIGNLEYRSSRFGTGENLQTG